MGIFSFDAAKYIVKVESPRVDQSLEKRQQVKAYLVRYMDMYSHDYIQKAMISVRIYCDSIMTESQLEAETAEDLALYTFKYALEDYINKRSLDELKYQRPLAAQEAFRMYCGVISKMLEHKVLDRKQAEKSIGAFYKKCGLD